MSKKVGISVPDIVYKFAKIKADLLFGGNISSYISNLIFIDNLEQIKKETSISKSSSM
ncbi:hypothetical protein [Clostridium estertheticum]|uniref:hypothetical protein n=1 Tax=Clostridium estertheticum TaxID=238834 RepID=UPI001C0AF773|nr:hypothetical protein [Clostridium estertheticum]MBU3173386.1 hypothetical protein [Clostridium estertheticum]